MLLYIILLIAIQQIVDNPPDGSMMCGAPVVYSLINKTQAQTDHEPASAHIVVRGLPLRVPHGAFKTYLKNVTHADFESCNIKDGEAHVVYKNSQGNQKWRRLTFVNCCRWYEISEQPTHFSIPWQSFGIFYGDEDSSPAAVRPYSSDNE